MTETKSIKNLLNRFDEAKTELDALLEPAIESWLQLQVKFGFLDKLEASQEFVYVEQTETGVEIRSEAWEETWQYGGREYHGANEITVPFEYLEDPDKYESALLTAKQERDQKIAEQAEKALQAKKASRKQALLKELATYDM